MLFARSLLGCLLMTALVPRALTAECISPPYPCDTFAGAKNVFIAKVISTELVEEILINEEFGAYFKVVDANILVERVFKGLEGQEGKVVDSHHATGETWLEPEVGTRYLVFARYDGLSFDMCDGTHPIGLRESFPVLERLRKGMTPPALAGNVRSVAVEGTGIPNAWVRFVGPSANLVARTDEYGDFNLDDVPLGAYSINFDHDEHYWRPTFDTEREIEVTARGCSYADIAVHPNNQLQGRLIDREGRAIYDALVTLDGLAETWGDYSPWDTAHSDLNGTFSFRGIRPGKYLLGVYPDGRLMELEVGRLDAISLGDVTEVE